MATVANFLLSLLAGLLFVLQSVNPCFSADAVLRRWIPLNGSTLRDVQSGLEWTRSDNGHDIDWQQAGRLCNGLPGKWRLPTAAELGSLHEATAGGTRCGAARCQVPAAFELTGD